MRLLLDTHALLWWLADNPRLGVDARTAVADPVSEVFVSAASAWEIAIKKAIGKLEAPDDLPEQIRSHHFSELPIKVSHALAAGSLPRHHEDPFDRLLVAQARIEGLTLVSHDQWAPAYGVPVLAT